MSYNKRALADLAQDLIQETLMEKSAAIGVGGQQVVPTQFVNPASGMYDPNPANALYSQLSQARADAYAASILDGQVSGTNLLPYQNVLNEGYGSVRAGMNVQMGPRKTASALDEEVFDLNAEDFAYIMADTGLFDESPVVPDQEGWDLITMNAMSKAASDTDDQIIDMYNSGIFHENYQEMVPFIEEALYEAGYLG